MDLVTMLKVVGAAVLIWLGVKAWRGALTGEVELSEAAAPAATWWRRFGEGVVLIGLGVRVAVSSR